VSSLKPKLLLLDEPHPRARAIMEEVADIVPSSPDIIYTQLTPVDTKLPVFCPCTGVEHIQSPKIIHLDEQWKKLFGHCVTSTAEHTFSLILQLAKLKRMQLHGKTLGIIGYGRIGQMVANYALAFGMRVIGADNGDIQGLLKQSDIITLHVPLNEETKGMIGKKEFELMKDGVLLVNTSRQSIVDINALNLKRIYYADDFKNEIDLTKHGAIQTPHIAGNCLEAREMTDLYISQKIKEYINGL
jgi:phosphoglycerate dehydrogenase-like enzyme